MRSLPLILTLVSCGLMGSSGPEKLQPESAMKHACFDAFTESDHAEVSTALATGQGAVDFTLKTPEGKEVKLSELLATKPVVVHTGSYTCDRYQGKEKAIAKFAKIFKDDVHTVLVYTTEAHPKTEVSPYRGRVWKRTYSDRDEADSWKERAKNAGDLKLNEHVTILIDEMDNPFWCTYGTCPNCSFLIAQDGAIEAVHKWHDPKTMVKSTRVLLDREKAAKAK